MANGSGQSEQSPSGEADGSAPSAGTSSVAATPLESLTPSFVDGYHGTYLRRLEEAVKDPSNLNIALTGRYGAGKSSVLDEFQANHPKTVQRLAISTLAPGEEGETTTNRIQKEIVKQLLYGASHKVGKNSRFSKISVLSRRRAVAESVGVVTIVGGLLYLLGWLPDIKWTGTDESTRVRVAAWAGAAVLATLAVAVVRMVTYGQSLSDVSAGPAALTLSDKVESFFDENLDEIVYYFGRESKDVVIFEDLDRFEDPGIFEALRELNVLLNETPERRAKRRGNRPGRALRWVLAKMSEDLPDRIAARVPYPWAVRLLGLPVPLRFVYAVRDSVFEKIDATPAATSTTNTSVANTAGEAADDLRVERVDAAAAETLRANRTKFFDIVIPLVPFISHRNSRDLLVDVLAERGITGIELRLVNTVARHCTDMRLLRNICNEYLVFAERLLEPQAPNTKAPGMDESHLFALVVYKNFHLKDFENITRRDSDLDRLYDLHQRMVRDTIAALDERKRALVAAPDLVRTRTNTASMLGARLTTFADAVRRASHYSGSQIEFRVGSAAFDSDEVTGYEFWGAVARHRAIDIVVAGSGTSLRTLDKSALEWFAPEGLDANRWVEYDDSTRQTELDDIERAIARLRRADFEHLAAMPEFTLPPTMGGTPAAAESSAQTFAQLLTKTLESELARDLVRRGYIDRNFPLYAAQFYGKFTGVDVANFMVQHVQTNDMSVDYDLSRPGAVANLLAEAEDAGEELEHTVAAFNIDIVNHLLANNHPHADVVVNNLIASSPDQKARTFLAAYFTSDNSERVELAARLAEHRWRGVFTYLVGDDKVPANARAALVSAAACAFDPHAPYDLGDAVREFITGNYGAMPAFTEQHPADAAVPPADRVPKRVDALLDRAGVLIPKLADVLDTRLHELVVAANRYELSADNLRSALAVTGDVSLDEVHANDTVYAYCLAQLPAYLAAVRHDDETDYAVKTPQALETVLNDVVAVWDQEQLTALDAGDVGDLLARTSPDARLSSLRSVPESTWTELAAAGLFRASLANVEDYRTHIGSIDAHLAKLLERAGTVHVTESGDTTTLGGGEYDRQVASVALLNATALTPEVRVDLAASIGAPTPLPVADIAARADNLFALLLERGLVDDDETTFAHFHEGGWTALGPAIKVSNNIETFLKPELLAGMVQHLLADHDAAAKVGRIVVADVDEYVPDDDWADLKAVARYADTHRIALTPDTVVRIVRVGRANGEVNPKLALRQLVATNPVASAEHIVAVFEELGPDYNKIRQSGAKVKFDRDDAHNQLLSVLQNAGLVTRSGTGKLHYSATVN